MSDGTYTLLSASARGAKIPCLDHGFVKLVDWMGDDLSIIRNARCSHNAAWRAGSDAGSDHRLMHYLWSHQHTTPFEAVTLQFEVKLPIFVARQWHRHRTWSYNEISARYRELPSEYYVPTLATVGTPDPRNKQGRQIPVVGSVSEDITQEIKLYTEYCEGAFKLYALLLNNGWPREIARGVLPVATYTHMFATVNLLNLFKFLTLRLDMHAQYEIRVYAEALRWLASSVAPVAFRAFDTQRITEMSRDTVKE